VPVCLVMLSPATYTEPGPPGVIYRECPVGNLHAVLGIANQARQRLACMYPLGYTPSVVSRCAVLPLSTWGQIPDMFRSRTQF